MQSTRQRRSSTRWGLSSNTVQVPHPCNVLQGTADAGNPLVQELHSLLSANKAEAARHAFEEALAPLEAQLKQVRRVPHLLLPLLLLLLHCRRRRCCCRRCCCRCRCRRCRCRRRCLCRSPPPPTSTGSSVPSACTVQGQAPAPADVPPPYAWKMYFVALAGCGAHPFQLNSQLLLMQRLGVPPQARQQRLLVCSFVRFVLVGILVAVASSPCCAAASVPHPHPSTPRPSPNARRRAL